MLPSFIKRPPGLLILLIALSIASCGGPADPVEQDTATPREARELKVITLNANGERFVDEGENFRNYTYAKTNWANRLDAPPFRAYPVTCGITFTYAGLRIDESAAVLDGDGTKISGLYACGEMIGGIFAAGYPGGSGLTSGAVFGRIAGRTAASFGCRPDRL